MKVIHTADWHIGQSFYNYDRSEEHKFFFNQLNSIVEQEKPDALLISADVYTSSLPSNSATKLYTDALINLHKSCTSMRIYVIAGNHDSYTQLEATRQVWKLANVKIWGTIKYDNDKKPILDDLIDYIPGKGYVATIPYRYLLDIDIFKQIQEKVRQKNISNEPLFMMGHLAVQNSNFTGHDLNNIGGIDCESTDSFGNYFSYIALGHIHYPQTLLNQGRIIRYSGSALHINFDENYPHSVTVITSNSINSIEDLREIVIEQKEKMYTLPAQPAPFEEVIKILNEFNPDKSGYLRLNILVKDYLPNNCQNELLNIISTKENLKFCLTKTTLEHNQEEESDKKIFNTEEIKSISPIELAKIFYEERNHIQMEPEMEDLLNKIIKETNETL